MPEINKKTMPLILLLGIGMASPFALNRQIKPGILPVAMASGTLETENPGLPQSLENVLHTFIPSLPGSGIEASIISDEHLLLILKGIQSDPANLSEEELQIICKNDHLDFLIKCRIGSPEVIVFQCCTPCKLYNNRRQRISTQGNYG